MTERGGPLKILSLHNRYLYPGGEDRSHAASVALLRERGHQVDVLFEDNARVAELGPLHSAVRTVWSQESYARVRRQLRRERYHLLDVHNTFPLLSPAVYYAARAEGVPVVQTLHNYRLVCPSATLFRDGRPCEDCVGRAVPWPGVKHACYRGSHLASATVATMLAAHRLVGTWTRMVDVYVALTEFERRKLIQGGLPPDRIMVRPNFVHPDPGLGAHQGGFALFAGRLSPEKGIQTLLAAWTRLESPVRLKIAGDGPLAREVTAAAERSGGHIEWLGQRTSDELADLMGQARLLVLPSECYETFGLVAIEAYARGTPVLASNLGAMAEVVEDGRTGLLVPPGQPDALARRIDWAWGHPEKLQVMGSEARRVFEAKYTADRIYDRVRDVFSRAMAR